MTKLNAAFPASPAIPTTTPGYVHRAMVRAVLQDGSFEVSLEHEGCEILVNVVAMREASSIAVGDRVLVALESRARGFVLGRFDGERRIVSKGGASASIEDRDGEERIAVRDASARLLFELDPATGRTLVSATAGDLSISAGGDVEIVAGGSIRCRGEKEIALEAGTEGSRSRFVLGEAISELSSRVLRLAADRADLAFTEASCASDRFVARVGDAKLVLTRLETVTDRLFERARSVFRTVEDLHQLKAGRTRTLVKDSYDLKAGHATIEAEAEMKIDGKTIHLG